MDNTDKKFSDLIQKQQDFIDKLLERLADTQKELDESIFLLEGMVDGTKSLDNPTFH